VKKRIHSIDMQGEKNSRGWAMKAGGLGKRVVALSNMKKKKNLSPQKKLPIIGEKFLHGGRGENWTKQKTK